VRQRKLLMLLCAAAVATAGCGSKHIVRAAPPSVSTPPPEEPPPAPSPPAPAPVETKTEEPLPELPLPPPPPAPVRRPSPRPRPEQPETAEPAPPKPEPPQISPQLSAQDLAAAKTNTAWKITTAEKNVQLANGRRLNAAQKDLVEKIKGFLAQAHGAILADDWIRAQNLAEKARILSVELEKSF
jgi:hypothetical protein